MSQRVITYPSVPSSPRAAVLRERMQQAFDEIQETYPGLSRLWETMASAIEASYLLGRAEQHQTDAADFLASINRTIAQVNQTKPTTEEPQNG